MSKALDKALESLQKRYGAENISKMSEMGSVEIEKIKTGSIRLDDALGGGYPRGRIVEIYGPESSGKTTLAIHAMANVQKDGGNVAFIDAEHAFDKFYAENIGVDTDSLIFSQPNNGEEALTIAQDLASTGEIDLIVIDSVSALIPTKQLEGDFGDANVGLQARMMSQGLMKLIGTVKKSNCTVIFINQIRMKIGVMFGSPETTSGGQALKFYASQRIDIRRIGSEKEGEEIVANKIKVKVVKNKVAPPFKVIETFIEFGTGISVNRELLEEAVNRGIIKKNGSWFSFEETKLGQGQSTVLSLMADNPEMCEEIHKKIYSVTENISKEEDEDGETLTELAPSSRANRRGR